MYTRELQLVVRFTYIEGFFDIGFLHKEQESKLLKECAKMQELDHPNVLPLRGVCLDGGPAPYIIMPFMTNGSLLDYLNDNQKILVLDPSTVDMDKAVRKFFLS